MAPLSEFGVALVLVVLASVCSFILLSRHLPGKRPSSVVCMSSRGRRRMGGPPKEHVNHAPDIAVSTRRRTRSSTHAKSSHAQPRASSSPRPVDGPSAVTEGGEGAQDCSVASALLRLDASCAPLTEAGLLGLDATARERELGERLYVCVRLIDPCRSGKITGMLLELENDELLAILGAGGDAHARAATLQRWVVEANEVLAAAVADEACTALSAATAPSAPRPIQAAAIEDWQLVERKASRTRRRTLSAHSPDSVVATSIANLVGS